MERVYKNTDEIIDKMKITPVFDGSGLRLNVYLDGRKVGLIDKHNKEIRTTVKMADEEKAELEETNQDIVELARLVYAEAAGQYKIANAMEGIAWVVRNRVEANKSWLGGNTYHVVIHHKGQFASIGTPRWNEGVNPESLSGPAIEAYKRALSVARGVYNDNIADPTGGALFFHSGQRESLPPKSAAFFGRLKPTDKNIPPFYFYK